MGFKCIIIDDQQYSVDALTRYINDMPNLEVTASFTNPLVALSTVGEGSPVDFIFLDIEMPGLSGLQLAKILRDKTKFLIFITSHQRHALGAFDLRANQYLLKPVAFPKFAAVVSELIKTLAHPVKGIPSQFHFIKAEYKNTFHYINPSEILCVQASGNYVFITIGKEQFITHVGLNALETSLPTTDFIRISKSYIIAKNAIKKIDGNTIRLKNDQIVQLGRTYKQNFVNFVRENMI